MSEEFGGFLERMLNTVDKISFGADKSEKIRTLMWFVELSFRYNVTLDEVIKRFEEAIKKIGKI